MKRLMMVLMLTLLALVGCKQSNPMTELLNYKGSYIGDNAAVGHIIERLPAHEYLDGFELQTSQEPYGITINYRNFDEVTIELEDGSTSKVSLNEILQSNSMILLSLVTNAEIVSFNLENQETITFDRATLSKNYGSSLNHISEDLSSLQNFIKSYAHK